MKRRNGFTLIELLVVIGIIMVLVAILAYSYRSMNRTSATKETHAELKVCKAMLTEYEGRNQFAGIESSATVQTADPGATSPGMFPVYCDPGTSINPSNTTLVKPGAIGTFWPSLQLTDYTSGSNTDMSSTSTDPSNPSPRYFSPSVASTLDVMYVLARIPANATMLQNQNPKRKLELPTTGSVPWAYVANVVKGKNAKGEPVDFFPTLLDGWGNPIIFVPRAGMHVNITDPASGAKKLYLVRSTGAFDATSGDPPLTGNERPFFASAGQDGDFTAGEDNVYSFNE